MSHRHLPLHCLYRKFRVSATQATTLSVSVRQWICITSNQWREPPLFCREYYFFAIERSTHAQAFLSETEPIRLIGLCCQDIAVLGQQILQLRQVECFLLLVLQYLKFKQVEKIILILSNLSEGLPEYIIITIIIIVIIIFLLLEIHVYGIR